ncbi:GPI-linked NAD(P)(+)--arginine ADP-ribosyltransferase 1 [Bagarius yarrelli]|uniref:NAD(P)(+)--arginine ADP-ribosyltransferase n=1 Tax=Bagarius yarrelli TaxID=175774 RepID=A0A556V842_BAGYA|nr:GPI-linked NAD(P)(+)--arginine ADP-ribosyltransferase 1 [Bagarius yarrelli]
MKQSFHTITNNIAIAFTIASSVLCTVKLHMTSKSVLPLDMALNSVDDQYKDCVSETNETIYRTILKNELNKNKKFADVWERYSKDDDLTKLIKAYTIVDFHAELNNAVRTNRKTYTKKFNFKVAHFFLTLAIQKYQVKDCVEVLRRSKNMFKKNVLGKEMRFGLFASSSRRPDLVQFGNISCFKIQTCLGADISEVSLYSGEKEVLIPPYEKFKIINVSQNHMNCSVLYTLQSTGSFSNMKCELVKKNQKTM